jgi:hypothetical protein
MKSFLSFFKPLYAAMLLACMGLAACGGDDGNGSGSNGSNGAPSNVKGKEFVFYDGDDLDWQFRVTPSGSDGSALLMTNSSTSLIAEPYCYYRKGTGNTATVQINYSSYVSVGGAAYGRMIFLDLKLTFTSKNGGIYSGTSTVAGGMGGSSTDQMSGYFTYDTEFTPTWQGDTGGNPDTPGGGDDEQGGGSPGDMVSSALGVEITRVSASNAFTQHSVTFRLEKNSTSNLPSTVGFIIGTSPGVTLDNALKVREESSDYLNGYSTFFGAFTTEADLLEGATRYYIRPFHREGNRVTYYNEESVETLGDWITLDLRNNLIPVFTFAYDIKRSGRYEIKAQFRVNSNGNVSFYEKVYKTVTGGSGYVTVDARNDTPYDWDTEVECVWGIVTDLETGIVYQPPLIHGGAPSSV